VYRFCKCDELQDFTFFGFFLAKTAFPPLAGVRGWKITNFYAGFSTRKSFFSFFTQRAASLALGWVIFGFQPKEQRDSSFRFFVPQTPSNSQIKVIPNERSE
jgi:hypothetical protein